MNQLWMTHLELDFLSIQIYDTGTEFDTNSMWRIGDD